MRAVKPIVQNALGRVPSAQLKRPVLQTSIGSFMGTQLQVSNDQQVSVFLSIPFAEPPINERRFELPIRPSFVPIREAVKMPEACHKTEDCLYLNLFIPSDRSTDPNGYPLLLFIPGGGFDRSTCAPHSMPYMAEHYCSRGIAYATVQYRVGLFGFGSDDSSDFKGNYALSDVCQSLLFLIENAHQIGFDPNRITIAGHSAGGSILSALSVSPKSRDLFSQAIQFSGSSLSLIATGNLVVNETQKIVNKLRGTNKVTNSKEFLKQFPATDLLKAYKEIGPPNNGASVIRFSPRVDGNFIPNDYFDLIKEAPPKPTLNTNSQNEGVVFALFNYLESIAEVSLEDAAKFNANFFRQKIRDLLISEQIWGQKTQHGVNEIFKFYAKNSENKDNLFYLNCYTKAIHDCYFGVPAKMEMLEKMRCGWPVYNGIFDRLHQAVHPPKVPLKVPTHGSEYLYLFGHLKNTEQLFDEMDKKYRDFWIESIADFVKYGSPKSAKNHQWELATTENSGVVLRVQDDKPKLEQNHLEEELLFWNKLNKLSGYNIVRQMPLN